MRAGAAAATVLVVVAAVAAIGCGGEREFTAEQFIDAANEQGAELELGEEVATTPAGEPVLKISSAPAPDSDPQLQTGSSSGTLVVASDVGSAGAEFDHCEEAADLTCFRVANVVLRFEGDERRRSGPGDGRRQRASVGRLSGIVRLLRRTLVGGGLAAALPHRGHDDRHEHDDRRDHVGEPVSGVGDGQEHVSRWPARAGRGRGR